MKYLCFVAFCLLSQLTVAQVQINDPLSEPIQIPQAWELDDIQYKVSYYEGAQGSTIIIGTGVGPWCTYEHSQ